MKLTATEKKQLLVCGIFLGAYLVCETYISVKSFKEDHQHRQYMAELRDLKKRTDKAMKLADTPTKRLLVIRLSNTELDNIQKFYNKV